MRRQIAAEIISVQVVFKASSSKALKFICIGRSPGLFSLLMAFPFLSLKTVAREYQSVAIELTVAGLLRICT
jgi:hypothetical protein